MSWSDHNRRVTEPIGGLLYRIAGGIRERAEELAQLQRLDNGKPIRECRALVASAARGQSSSSVPLGTSLSVGAQASWALDVWGQGVDAKRMGATKQGE